MKLRSKLIALLTAAVLCTGLVACGSGSGGISANDATVYVQGLLDRTYLGQHNEDYMDLVGSDLETMEEYYQDGLETEADYFVYYFDLQEPSDELFDAIVEFYAKLYKNSKYTVSPASKLSTGGYAVEVVVEPLDIIDLIAEDYEEVLQDFWGNYTQEQVDAMSDEEYTALDNQWAFKLLELANEKLESVGYKEKQYITVQVRQDDEGVWSLVDSDFDTLDAAIIAY